MSHGETLKRYQMNLVLTALWSLLSPPAHRLNTNVSITANRRRNMEPNNEELESFRRKWLAEVSSRSNRRASQPKTEAEIHAGGESGRKQPPPRHAAADREEEEDLEEQATAAGPSGDLVSNELIEGVQGLDVASTGDDSFHKEPVDDPKSALEHFEKAVLKEAQGSLGDSLSLYRKAYRVGYALRIVELTERG